MSSSRNASSSSNQSSKRNLINRGIIKFHNKVCYCRHRTTIKVSESISNPNRLYYSCPNDLRCGSLNGGNQVRRRLHKFDQNHACLKNKLTYMCLKMLFTTIVGSTTIDCHINATSYVVCNTLQYKF